MYSCAQVHVMYIYMYVLVRHCEGVVPCCSLVMYVHIFVSKLKVHPLHHSPLPLQSLPSLSLPLHLVSLYCVHHLQCDNVLFHLMYMYM